MKIVMVDFDKMIFVRTTLRTILRHLITNMIMILCTNIRVGNNLIEGDKKFVIYHTLSAWLNCIQCKKKGRR